MTDAELVFRQNTVLAPLESAVSFQGPYRILGVRFEELTVEDAPVTVDVRPRAHGEASFSQVSARGTSAVTFRNPEPQRFKLLR